MVDGNLCFPIAATMATTFELTGKSVRVVGIGYQSDDYKNILVLRARDLTSSAPASANPQTSVQSNNNESLYGGAELFYEFITNELIPNLSTTYKIDKNNTAIYGHSVGGLFATEVLLKYPHSFSRFIISSPSLWWNKNSTLRLLKQFETIITGKSKMPKILFFVGEQEEDAPKVLPPSIKGILDKKTPILPKFLKGIVAKVVVKKMIKSWAMINNVNELVLEINKLDSNKNCLAQLTILRNEDHLTALPSSITQGIANFIGYNIA